MNTEFLNKITCGDCRELLPKLDKESIHLFLSDIPYGINLDEWDVLHNNTNSALLGSSPAQEGKNGFKRRGKPINGWSSADKNIGFFFILTGLFIMLIAWIIDTNTSNKTKNQNSK